jgi:hypothetical protein
LRTPQGAPFTIKVKQSWHVWSGRRVGVFTIRYFVVVSSPRHDLADQTSCCEAPPQQHFVRDQRINQIIMADNEEELVDYDEEEVRTEDRDGPAWLTTDPRPDRTRIWIFGVAK